MHSNMPHNRPVLILPAGLVALALGVLLAGCPSPEPTTVSNTTQTSTQTTQTTVPDHAGGEVLQRIRDAVVWLKCICRGMPVS
ncbi:MAG: hypothetical protein J7M38_13740 [Armatimonadetes bacterium]|nr:hypothetical protein [Armatimonadota bacterium]